MIGFRVLSAAGAVLAIFRHETQAADYLHRHQDRPEAVLRAVSIEAVQVSEGAWDPWHVPLTEPRRPPQ